MLNPSAKAAAPKSRYLMFAPGLGALVLALSLAGCVKNRKILELKKKCENRVIRACFTLSKIYGDGLKVERNIVESKKRLRQGLSVGSTRCLEEYHSLSCHVLAAQYYRGSPYGLPRNKKKARSFFEHGCDLGETRSCSMLREMKVPASKRR